MQESRIRDLLEEVLIKSFETNQCVVIIAGPPYTELFTTVWFQRFKLFISYILVICFFPTSNTLKTFIIFKKIHVPESEDLFSPKSSIQQSLEQGKKQGCQLYLILLANGLQTARLLKYGDR